MAVGTAKSGSFSKKISKSLQTALLNKKLKKKCLHALGRSLVKHIVAEAKKDFAKAKRSPRGKPVPSGGGLGESFFKSVRYRLVGESSIEVYSKWEWIDSLLVGAPKAKMSHMVAENNPKLWRSGKEGKVRKALPLKGDDGKIIFRVAPLKLENAWVHPGIHKHTFWERGRRKWRATAASVLAACIQKNLNK